MRDAEKTRKREANLKGSLVEPRKANTGVLRCLPVDLAQTVSISGHILAFGTIQRPPRPDFIRASRVAQERVEACLSGHNDFNFLILFQGWHTFRDRKS